ncbi:MAG: hypothetical protein RJB57_217 [Actinomycetota bacterium]
MAAVNNEPTTPTAVMDLAVRAEQQLHGLIDSFELPGARLYGINLPDAVVDDPPPCLLGSHPDVYRLLSEPSSALARSFGAAAIVTTGWAAPLDDNGEVSCPPSQHARRRRVRLMVLVSNEGTASVLRFADDPDEVVTDPGSATGSLAEAIARFWFEPPCARGAVPA